MARFNEEYIREELKQIYDNEIVEIIYQFLDVTFINNFYKLRSKIMKEEPGERLLYLTNFFKGLMNKKDSFRFSIDLLVLFNPDKPELLRTNWPNLKGTPYINHYNVDSFHSFALSHPSVREYLLSKGTPVQSLKNYKGRRSFN